MSAPRRSPLSGADSAWWGMDRPVNPMVITAVLVFDSPLDFVRLRAAVEKRLLAHPRFRQRVVPRRFPWSRPHWEDDPSFSLDHHLRRARPQPTDERGLQALVGRLMSSRLDYRRPPWRMDVVERYRGGSAIVARLHHCIADGLALLQVLLALDDAPGNEDVSALTGGAAVMRRPPPDRPAHARAGRMAATGAAAGVVLARLVLGRGDSRTPLRGRLGLQKRAAWSRAFALEEVRAAGRARGCTVHDVLAAVVAGALRGYLAGAGTPRRVRAVVPVNLRTAAEWGTLGNRFGLVFLRLPVEEAEPGGRLAATHRAMARLKRSPQAGVIFVLLRVFGRLGKPLLSLAVRILARRASLVLTDVPGPREAVRLCGARLSSLMAWVPQSGPLGLGIAVLSYAGQVRIGVAADARLGDAPARLVAGLEREMVLLLGEPAPREAALTG